MKLSEVVKINEYFRRSVNIKSDLNNKEFLEGYICPKSSEEAIIGLVKHIDGTQHSSFTWTGPYGAGKSSLVILLSSLLSTDKTLQKTAYSRLSPAAQDIINGFFNQSDGAWQVLPVVGEPLNPLKVISKSMVSTGFCTKEPADSQEIIDRIREKAETNAGVIIFIDEMGKFLESLSNGQADTDIYLFQQLAELANNSNGKIILVGILHQSFNEYARHLSRIARDEWTKIQGRFVDYHINTAGEEQLELISRAIVSDEKPKYLTSEAKQTAATIKKNRPINEESFAKILNACWPLHPVVAGLLGPISRRRFGQNQRSIFSFLNSAEPSGFREFISSNKADRKSFYYPSFYWDYIQLNLESSIIASSDSKLWALATDSLAKCEAYGGTSRHMQLLKTISVIDIFKGHSGIIASKKILETCGFKEDLESLIKDLSKWSLIRFKKHSDSFSIFEGSDFDLDTAIDEAIGRIDTVNFVKLAEIASFKPYVAKKHYHMTGTLRWMDVNIIPADRIEELVSKTIKSSNAFGGFFIIVPSDIDEYESAQKELKFLSKKTSDYEYAVVYGISDKYEAISSYSKELLALEWIEDNRHEMLDGDSVARREVEARKALITAQLEELLTTQINTVSWLKDGKRIGTLSSRGLMAMVSDIADHIFTSCPIVKSEMLNRDKPSSNANAALNALLKAFIMNSGEKRMGIKGYPPEGGLFKLLMEDAGLYVKQNGGWILQEPKAGHKFKFDVLWKKADEILQDSNISMPIQKIYDEWKKPPFGVKSGLLPFFSAVYLITRHDKIALYLSDTYRPSFDDFFLDHLLRTPQAISLRWVNYDALTLSVLEAVKKSVNSVESSNISIDDKASAFDIARSLVSLVDNLNPWVHRTRRLSRETVRFRELIKTAHDPNKLLFDDLPSLLNVKASNVHGDKEISKITDRITESLVELTEIYPKLLNELGNLLLQELQAGIATENNIARLRERAKSIQGITGDFRIDALAARLISFKETHEDIAGIASLAANKPTKDWIDLDVDRAKQEIVSLCSGFKKAELLARVQGRKSNRHAVAFITALSGKEEIHELEFDLLEDEKEKIMELKELLRKQIADSSTDIRTALAVIAELGADYIKDTKSKSEINVVESKKVSNVG